MSTTIKRLGILITTTLNQMVVFGVIFRSDLVLENTCITTSCAEWLHTLLLPIPCAWPQSTYPLHRPLCHMPRLFSLEYRFHSVAGMQFLKYIINMALYRIDTDVEPPGNSFVVKSRPDVGNDFVFPFGQ